MVVGAFPIVKLAVLLVKQVSKPIANFTKERAKTSRFFRTYICMPPAQFYNWCEVQSKMWIMNMGKPVNIPPMNEQMAIELGANLLGEGIIFTLGAVLLILEYNRSAKKEAQKEEQRLLEMDHLNSTLNDLYFSVQKQRTQIVEMERIIYDLESRVVLKPWVGKKEKEPSGRPPTEPPGPAAGGAQPIKKINPENATTPYPERGIISKSLNYLELVVLNTPQPEEKIEPEEPAKPANKFNRKPSLITDALHYIEHDVKGVL